MGEQARDLQIEEDLSFQRHQMRFERIGWAVMGLVVLAALVGLLGGGPLSTATAGTDDDPIRVRYERFDRRARPTVLTVELVPPATEGQARVAVDRAWAEGVTIEAIQPEPESVDVGPEHLVYAFAVQPGAERVQVTFQFEYERWGWLACEIGLDGGPAQSFGMFVFP